MSADPSRIWSAISVRLEVNVVDMDESACKVSFGAERPSHVTRSQWSRNRIGDLTPTDDAVLCSNLQCHDLGTLHQSAVAGSIWRRWLGKVVMHQRSRDQLRESFHFLYRVEF
jgi:hypothetical protein